MKFTQIKNSTLKKCKDYILAENCLVGFTGKQILLFDQHFDLIAAQGNLSYVYTGELSPRCDKLLTVSNGNRFYIHEFPSLNPIDNVTVRAPYNDNIEGRGCWSLDGKSVMICATNSKTLNSVLRVYNANDFSEYTDFLSEKYWLMDIQAVSTLNKYYLIGFNRVNFKTYIIWYDGEKFEEYPLENLNNTVFGSHFNELYNLLEIYDSSDSILIYDCKGKLIKKQSRSIGKEYKISFSKVFKGIGPEKEQKLKSLSEAFGFKNMSFQDCVKNIVLSNNAPIAYVSTNCRVIAYDISACEIIDQIEIGYGVGRINEIDENKIIVSTWDGVLMYELV